MTEMLKVIDSKPKKINTDDWKHFKLSDLFETVGPRGLFPAGAQVLDLDDLEEGDTPRITASGNNNGIFGFFSYIGKRPVEYKTFTSIISLSQLGTCFYQPGLVSLDSGVYCLKPKTKPLNFYTAHFLISCIKAALYETNFWNRINNETATQITIKLPVDDAGQPDWQKMENDMRKYEAAAIIYADCIEELNKHYPRRMVIIPAQ